MPRIFSPAKPNKQVDGRSCGATLGYNSTDVKIGIDRDYLGDTDQYAYISCPCCAHEIRLPRKVSNLY